MKTIITTASKFFSSNHRIFIKAENNKVVGFLKVGVKKLFVRDELANYHEISPLCVLDFYVHESQQRGGHGKSLFEYMIQFESIHPRLLAYDRPSPKLIGFLSKHYNLNKYVSQNNNYVVFNDYFEFTRQEMSNKLSSRSWSKLKESNSLANYGQQLIGGTNSNNNYSLSSKIPGATPNKIFANYYLNEQNTNYYDGIYSKKKLHLLNDYLSSNKKEPEEYVR